LEERVYQILQQKRWTTMQMLLQALPDEPSALITSMCAEARCCSVAGAGVIAQCVIVECTGAIENLKNMHTIVVHASGRISAMSVPPAEQPDQEHCSGNSTNTTKRQLQFDRLYFRALRMLQDTHAVTHKHVRQMLDVTQNLAREVMLKLELDGIIDAVHQRSKRMCLQV
jgi:ribosomal protein S25